MRRLAMKMLTLALVVLLGGCATYTAVLYGTGSASSDWIQCQKDIALPGSARDTARAAVTGARSKPSTGRPGGTSADGP